MACSNLKNTLNTDELVAMLKSENYFLRRNAARLLGKIKAADAVADLGFALKDEKVHGQKGGC